MTTYKAIQINQTGDVDVLNYTDLLKPTPGPDDVLVKNEFIGANFIDVLHRSGKFPVPSGFPTTFGIEGAGVVDSIGSQVQGMSVGDRVVYIGYGSYGEFTIAKRNHVAKLPYSITFKTASTIVLQGLTALTMVQESYKVKKGDFVLIHAAAGGTGQQLVRLANYFGATVIGTTSSTEKAEIARKAGAHHVINYKEDDVIKNVQGITKGNGVHAVLDSVGQATFDISLASVRRSGTIVSFGVASGPAKLLDTTQLFSKNIRLLGTSIFVYLVTQEEFEHWTSKLFKLYEQGAVHEEVYKVYPLREANRAHSELEGGKTTGKLLLTV